MNSTNAILRTKVMGGDRVVASLALLVAILAGGCGGASGERVVLAQAASRVGSAVAMPLLATFTAEAAMDYAEAHYAADFLAIGTTVTQRSGPFAYRYYPRTGKYIGVVVADGQGFPVGGVYVMGGEFGPYPTYVAHTDSLNLTDASLEYDNGCYSLANKDTPGVHWRIVQEQSGQSAGTMITERTVGGIVNFRGQIARELIDQSTWQATQGTSSSASQKFYERVSAIGELTEYGYISVSTSSQTVYDDPPTISRHYRLRVGESLYAKRVLYRVNTSGGGDALFTSTRTVVSYLGRESISVPAGTFETCKFEFSSPRLNQPGGSVTPAHVQTRWIIVGTGFDAKSTRSDAVRGTYQVIEATSITLNSAPLTSNPQTRPEF